MARSTTTYLRLYKETRPDSTGGLADFWPGLDKLCRAFEQATGWPLQCLPGGTPPTEPNLIWSAPAAVIADHREQLRVGVAIDREAAPTAQSGGSDLQASVDLAAAIGELLSDLARTRQTVWKQEAELAAGVPLPLRIDESHLAERLQASLRAAAQSAAVDAAALYLLDESTTYLKLRSVWGLPQERLLSPPRELSRSAADLEALLGHAIVLDHVANQSVFMPPEPAAAAICVPVSSATAPLGTLWVFGAEHQSFSDRDVNMVEVVAGRIAADLEREMFAAASSDANRAKRQFAAAERWQDSQLPHVSPISDVWQLAGWSQAAGELSNEFYDWFVRRDDTLTVALGGSRQAALEGALAASALRATVRAHADHAQNPSTLLHRIQQTLESGSSGDSLAALLVALADAELPVVRLASAGELIVWKITAGGASRLAHTAPPLGQPWLTKPRNVEVRFEPGDFLVAISEGAARTWQQASGADGEEELLSALLNDRDQPAHLLVELVQDRLTALASQGPLADCTALVLKCRA